MSFVSSGKYTAGQCTDYVSTVLPWIPAGLGNASDWWRNAPAHGVRTSSTPVAGAAAVYAAGRGYDPVYGHVAVVTGVNSDGTFTVVEMNWLRLGAITVRRSSAVDVLGFLVPPLAAPPQGDNVTLSKDERYDLARAFTRAVIDLGDLTLENQGQEDAFTYVMAESPLSFNTGMDTLLRSVFPHAASREAAQSGGPAPPPYPPPSP